MKQRATDAKGYAIRRAHNNQILDTQEYEVELEYRKTDSYFSNIIIYNVYSQLDREGHQTLVMSEIVDHHRDGSSFTKYNGFTSIHSNTPKNTTNGWYVLIEWNYYTTTWMGIKMQRRQLWFI